jgi:hypothetical protein
MLCWLLTVLSRLRSPSTLSLSLSLLYSTPSFPLAVFVKSNSLCPSFGGGGISCWGRRRQTDSVDRPVFRFLLHRFLFLFVFIIQPSSPFCAQRHLDNTTCHGGQYRRLSESALQLGLGSLCVCVCVYLCRPSVRSNINNIIRLLFGVPGWISIIVFTRKDDRISKKERERKRKDRITYSLQNKSE